MCVTLRIMMDASNSRYSSDIQHLASLKYDKYVSNFIQIYDFQYLIRKLKYQIMLCYVMLCYVMLCYVMLRYVMLCYVMLCYVMLCYVRLCYVMLCYVMLCFNIILL